MDSHSKHNRPSMAGMWPSALSLGFRDQASGSNRNSVASNTYRNSHIEANRDSVAEEIPMGNMGIAVDGPAGDNFEDQSTDEDSEEDGEEGTARFQAINPISSNKSHPRRPGLAAKVTANNLTEDDLFRALSRRRTNASLNRSSFASPTRASSFSGLTQDEQDQLAAENLEIEKLMSRMFGKDRREQSEEEKTRHVGVVFKNLTVKGMGLGAALQPTLGDPVMALPRLLKGLFSRGASGLTAKAPVRTILDNFTGCVRPGEMLLVLGPPGSGCSTFLKVLANQRVGYKDITGEVTYGGTDAKTMAKHYRGEILYNPEDDLHYATLSVKNTLKFALKTRTPGKASRMDGESRSEYISEFLRVVSKLFWIEHTMNTKVGDAYVRGVSGGEKKRVSIAEAMITRASAQCWDNSTKGLDASTALEYVQSLRSLTNMVQISTCIALYQAGESLYELFDKVVVLDEGKCLYFGPTETAAAYFEGLGFRRPPRWTTPDFLTSVIDPHERKVFEGYENRIPRSPEQFETAFRNSEQYQANLRDIEEFEVETEVLRRDRLAAEKKVKNERNYTLSFPQQVLACTDRQFRVMIGDKASLFGKWGGLLFQALIVGSTFYNMPSTSNGVFTRGGILFFTLLFNALIALAELTAAFSSRPILLKHKSFSFYRPAAYAIAQMVIDIPLVFIQVFIFNIVIYFMSGLARTASQFFINLLITWILTMQMYSFFRAIGAWCRSLDVATRITGVSIQILIVYTGYLIPPNKMHPWFKWLIWVNPVQYGFEALMANEFHRLNIQCVAPDLVPRGPGASPQYQSCTIQGSQPGQTTVNGEDYIRIAFTYSRAHLWRNFGIIVGLWLFYVFLTMVGMEVQSPNKGGGSVTVFKRGQTPASVQKSLEEGGPVADEEKAGAAGDVKLSDGEASDSEPDVKGGQGGQAVGANESILTFQNINYTIPYDGGERKLLDNVQGYVKPGKLTALMGASGAGKTTLLNTLAQRINVGTVTGDFLVDGKPLPRSFQRATGFAEQMDIHEPTSTVREALRFSALLRQPKEVPVAEKYEYCERIIDLLEMRSIAGATVGEIGSGLNQEQRKRVTIAVELASKPELLFFLDEPTSGLDSGAAFNIIRFLRKLADSGQALLVTIHQPSSVLFEYFDELLLLKSGGRVVYHGELGKDSRTLIDYFERNGADSCPSKTNPAEYMLEAIGAGNPDYTGPDWGDIWADSPEREAETKEIQRILQTRTNAPKSKTLTDDREYAMPLSTQLYAVIKRTFIAYWRTPDYMVGKFMLHIATGLFNTFTFYHVGEESIDMQSRLFSIFMGLTIAPPLIQQLQPRFLGFRNIYKSRENNSKIYSWFAFTTAAVLVELPYSAIAGTLYYNTWWWGSLGRGSNKFANSFTWMNLMLFELYYVGFGQAIAAFSPNDLLASLLVPIFFLFVISFCGVVVPYAALPYFWRSWMYYLTPFRYIMGAFLSVAVHGRPVRCASSEYARFPPPPGQSCESYVAPYIAQAGGYVRNGTNGLCEFCQYANGDEYARTFNIFYNKKWMYYGVTWAFCAFNFMCVFFFSWLMLGGAKSLRKRFSRK